MKTTELKKDEEYLDEEFPKGKTKFRGQAMVLLALARREGKKQTHAEEVDFLKNLDNLTPERNAQIEERIKQLSAEQEELKK